MDDVRDVMERWIESYNRHDLDAVRRCYGPRSVGVAPGGVAEGPDEIISYLANLPDAFPDAKVTPWQEMICGDTWILEFTFTGVHSGPYLRPGGGVIEPTGRQVAFRGCAIAAVEEGRIATHRFYYDQLELLSQLNHPIIS